LARPPGRANRDGDEFTNAKERTMSDTVTLAKGAGKSVSVAVVSADKKEPSHAHFLKAGYKKATAAQLAANEKNKVASDAPDDDEPEEE
jgi:ribosomal protein L1